jgi:hypothetical protein
MWLWRHRAVGYCAGSLRRRVRRRQFPNLRRRVGNWPAGDSCLYRPVVRQPGHTCVDVGGHSGRLQQISWMLSATQPLSDPRPCRDGNFGRQCQPVPATMRNSTISSRQSCSIRVRSEMHAGKLVLIGLSLTTQPNDSTQVSCTCGQTFSYGDYRVRETSPAVAGSCNVSCTTG